MVDIYNQKDQANFTLNNIRRVGYTPRSLEAFNRSGVLPEELVAPTLDQFLSQKVDPEVAKIKFQLAKDNRENKFKVLLNTYNEVCDLEAQGKWSPERLLGSISPKASVGAGQPKSAMIEAEKAALERIKMKQQKEIEKMLGLEFQKQAI